MTNYRSELWWSKLSGLKPRGAGGILVMMDCLFLKVWHLCDCLFRTTTVMSSTPKINCPFRHLSFPLDFLFAHIFCLLYPQYSDIEQYIFSALFSLFVTNFCLFLNTLFAILEAICRVRISVSHLTSLRLRNSIYTILVPIF